MFTKVDMHRIERVVCDNPLVTCSFVMSVADDNGKLNNVSRFEFHNYNTGQVLRIIGGKKKDLVKDLKTMLENRNTNQQVGDTNKRLLINALGERKTEISYSFRGYRHVLTHGTTEYVTTEHLKRLIAILDWYMEMRLPWIHDGFFDNRVKVSPDQTAEDLTVRIIRKKDSKNPPMAIALENDINNGQRTVRFLNGMSSLVLVDYTAGLKDTTIKKVLEKISNTLLHVLNYDQKCHNIDLFHHSDDISPEILTYKGYVALSQDAKHRRVVINFDQNIMCSKAHWVHERFFTKAVQEALSDIIAVY
ncbi:hypothetical protein JOAD_145 [Erwinia phage vB_EamM_Joad]|uniref:Uncharacterized protein n=1 Tax=Erwinia phage vB_EamM_Joad TaxID=2026081 RepID=A0A223LIH6_9CAUD|nr:hypothetical protein JOAD_145 [Erwinia phage vB_EamM_Joad]